VEPQWLEISGQWLVNTLFDCLLLDTEH